MRNPDKVLRHTPTERALHWIAAVSGILLLFSGFGEMPMYKRYFVTEIPGMSWSGDYGIQLIIHYIAGAVFTGVALFHGVYHWRKREFAILPQRGDMKESAQILWAILRGKPEPAHGKFLAEQRLAYVAIAGVSFLLIVTGLIKTYKNTGAVVLDPLFLNIVTYTHTLSTMLFLLLFLAHLGAFIIKANRPLLWSMFSGHIDRKYAEERHGHWKID